MSLISCPECNNEISDQAKSCPNCGHPIKKHKKSINKKILIISLLVCIIVGGISAYYLLNVSGDDILTQLCKPKLKTEDIEDILGKCENISSKDDFKFYTYKDMKFFPGITPETINVVFENRDNINIMYAWSIEISPDEGDKINGILDTKFTLENSKGELHKYKTENGWIDAYDTYILYTAHNQTE